jgi:hypothetical protein
MPPVRREHEFRDGSSEPLAEPVISDDFSRYVRDLKLELFALRRESNIDHPGKRISIAWWWVVWDFQFWSN